MDSKPTPPTTQNTTLLRLINLNHHSLCMLNMRHILSHNCHPTTHHTDSLLSNTLWYGSHFTSLSQNSILSILKLWPTLYINLSLSLFYHLYLSINHSKILKSILHSKWQNLYSKNRKSNSFYHFITFFGLNFTKHVTLDIQNLTQYTSFIINQKTYCIKKQINNFLAQIVLKRNR